MPKVKISKKLTPEQIQHNKFRRALNTAFNRNKKETYPNNPKVLANNFWLDHPEFRDPDLPMVEDKKRIQGGFEQLLDKELSKSLISKL